MSDVDKKLDKLDGRLDEYNGTLVRLTVTVEEHVKRTNLLEQDMKPVKAHVDFVNKLAKGIVALAAVATAIHQLGIF